MGIFTGIASCLAVVAVVFVTVAAFKFFPYANHIKQQSPKIELTEISGKASFLESKRLDIDGLASEETLKQVELPTSNYSQIATNKKHDLIISISVPKTGSGSFTQVSLELTRKLGYRVLLVDRKNYKSMSTFDQQRYAQELMGKTEENNILVVGHIHFMDFTQFGVTNPIYTSVVREPLERMISHYYFKQHGSDMSKRGPPRPGNQTFDDCIATNGRYCNLVEYLWYQLPYFCGNSPHCFIPSQWAVNEAKRNVLHHFLLVGLTDQLGDYFALLEAMQPRFFAGSYNRYLYGKSGNIRHTINKQNPSDATIAAVKKSEIYKMEKEFYDFVKVQFEEQQRRSLVTDKTNNRILVNPSRYKMHFLGSR